MQHRARSLYFYLAALRIKILNSNKRYIIFYITYLECLNRLWSLLPTKLSRLYPRHRWSPEGEALERVGRSHAL